MGIHIPAPMSMAQGATWKVALENGNSQNTRKSVMNYAPGNGCMNKTDNISRCVNVEEGKSHRAPPLDKELQATMTVGGGNISLSQGRAPLLLIHGEWSALKPYIYHQKEWTTKLNLYIWAYIYMHTHKYILYICILYMHEILKIKKKISIGVGSMGKVGGKSTWDELEGRKGRRKVM